MAARPVKELRDEEGTVVPLVTEVDEKIELDLEPENESTDPSMGRKIDPTVQSLVGSLAQQKSSVEGLNALLAELNMNPNDLIQLLQSSKATTPQASGITQLFTITVDGILKPDASGEWQGQVTRGELEAGGADVAWLIQSGAIVDEGFVRKEA